ncbi:hypothetical protein SprV_0702409700 [Sparganum proliferum]
MPTDIPGTNCTYWTSTDELRLSDRTSRRTSARVCPVASAATQLRLLFSTTTSILLLLLLLLLAGLKIAGEPRRLQPAASSSSPAYSSPSSSSSSHPSRRPACRRRQTGRVSPLTLVAWNVRSPLDNPRGNRPERGTALVVRELARYKLDIAALSETRFSEQGQLGEVGAGYTFFWSGRPSAERRDARVVFAIRSDIVGRLPCLSGGINDRLMSLRLPLRRGGQFATIISAYAPP